MTKVSMVAFLLNAIPMARVRDSSSNSYGRGAEVESYVPFYSAAAGRAPRVHAKK